MNWRATNSSLPRLPASSAFPGGHDRGRLADAACSSWVRQAGSAAATAGRCARGRGIHEAVRRGSCRDRSTAAPRRSVCRLRAVRPCCLWTPRADPIHRSDPKIDAWVFIVIINDHEEMMSIRILVLDFCASLDSIVQFASADERRRQLARKRAARGGRRGDALLPGPPGQADPEPPRRDLLRRGDGSQVKPALRSWTGASLRPALPSMPDSGAPEYWRINRSA